MNANKSLITTFFFSIMMLCSNVLAADISGNNPAQVSSSPGKATYSLLLPEDLTAFEISLTVPVREGKEQPEERGTTENLFSLEFPKLLLRDTRYILTSPAHWDGHDWTIFSVAALGVGAAAFLDNPVRNLVERNQNSSTSTTAQDVRCAAGVCSFAILGLFYTEGTLCHDDVGKAVAIDGAAASLVASGIVTPTLKFAFGRARPYTDEGNHYFTPFSGKNLSFPSGETTQAFTVASVVAAHYDELWMQGASYGIASLTGMARIYKDAHWTSDALAGGLIGNAVGTAIVRFNEKRRKAKKDTGLLIAPLFARGTAGIGITLVE